MPITEPRGNPEAGTDTRARLLDRLPVTERRLEVAGVSTAVLEAGDGPPVVVLHGIGQFAATWAPLIPGLMATHRVIVPDLPGQGASTVEDGWLDADRVLTWLGELIEHTCPSPPTLVGHQAGGAIAARFASEHGERISRLVLVDTCGLARFRPAPRFALAMVGFLARPTEHTLERFLGQCMADLGAVRQRMGEVWELTETYALENAHTPSVKAGGRRLMRDFGVPAIAEADLARIGVPTTLVWGRLDIETRLRVGEEASQRYGWPLHVVEDCAADPNIEQPERLLEILRDALDARQPSSSRSEPAGGNS